MTPDDERRYREKLELLDGTRSRQRRQAAVRIADLSGLLQIPDRLQVVSAAGATPTKAEFDALASDLEFIRARLFEVVTVLNKRLVP